MQQNVTTIASTDYNFIAAGDCTAIRNKKDYILYLYITIDFLL